MSFSEWKTYELGELCDEVTYGHTASADWKIDGPKFLRITDIQNYFVNWETVPQCPIKENEHKKYKLEEGDIVIARTGATTGTTYTFKGNVDAVFASYLIKFKINKKLANPFYVGYTLKSNIWKEFVASIIGGSAQPGANAKQFSSFEVPLPDLKTQQQIVSILGSIDETIELNQQFNKTLEEMAKAIFKEWFVDFNYPNVTGEFQETEIGKIPVGWKKGTIEDLLFHSKDSVNPSRQPDKDFFHYSIPAYDEGNNPSIEKGSTILSNKFQVKCNSILVSKLNPRFPRTWAIGEIEEERSICSTEFQVLVPRKPFYYSYGLWLFAQTFVIDKMKASATGTSGSHQRVRPQDILDIEIALPNDELLKLYHDTVSAFTKQIHDNKTENQSLSNLRDTLLPKLMKGEININL